jgi:hypothetical protein
MADITVKFHFLLWRQKAKWSQTDFPGRTQICTYCPNLELVPICSSMKITYESGTKITPWKKDLGLELGMTYHQFRKFLCGVQGQGGYESQHLYDLLSMIKCTTARKEWVLLFLSTQARIFLLVGTRISQLSKCPNREK